MRLVRDYKSNAFENDTHLLKRIITCDKSWFLQQQNVTPQGQNKTTSTVTNNRRIEEISRVYIEGDDK